tara:strand:+ start:315 stop:2261 length:1947 start_codon:yes stop_codon:yes gene_type:complete
MVAINKDFFRGLAGGIATGANRVIQADLAANSAKVSKMAGIAAERAIKKRDKYNEELKEFEQGVKRLSGKLGENGMDTAQFLISEYGSVEAAEAASVKLIERAEDMGTSVYEQLKLSGAVENRITPTGRQLALINVPKPILDDGKITIRNSGWASILGRDPSDEVQREKEAYLSAAGVSKLPQLKGDVAPVLQGIPSASIRALPKNLKEQVDRSNIRITEYEKEIQDLSKDPKANKDRIKKLNMLIAQNMDTIKQAKKLTDLTKTKDVDDKWNEVTLEINELSKLDVNDTIGPKQKERLKNLLVDQTLLETAMARKTAATTKGKSVAVTQTQAISRLNYREQAVRTKIGFPKGTSAASYARIFNQNFKDGMINKEDLPLSIIKDINAGKPPKEADIHNWINSTIAKAKTNEITNMLSNADLVTIEFLKNLPEYKVAVDVDRNKSLPIQTDGKAETMTKDNAPNLVEGTDDKTNTTTKENIVRKPIDRTKLPVIQKQSEDNNKRRDEILERLNVLKNSEAGGFVRVKEQELNAEFKDLTGQTVQQYKDSLKKDNSSLIRRRTEGKDPFEEGSTDTSVKKSLSTSNIRDGMIRGLRRSPEAVKKLISLVNTNKDKAVSDLMKNLTDRGAPVTRDIASDMLDQILTRITSE